MANLNEYYGRYLSSLNQQEFKDLDKELHNRKVPAQFMNTPSGGRIYRIPEQHLDKLPSDEKGPYLGDDNSGHSIYPVSEDFVSDFCGRGEWIDILRTSN